MSGDTAIRVEDVSKKFCRSLKRSMLYGIGDIGRNLAGLKSPGDPLRKNEFWAVNDVSFEVKRGETLGIIGPNGSGKTTLLKMLNGIFWPDKGRVTVRGRVGALIAVGAGFHPLLSGRENIYINGAILGMSRREIDRKFDAIVNFADVGDFLDMPVRNYSSGMHVRLGFAIAVHCQPDILLVDEVLAVGDIKFQAKCMRKIQEMSRQGVTKIFVSHNLNSVELLCGQAVYLSKGNIKCRGQTREVLAQFKRDAFESEEAGEANPVRMGTREIEITKVELLDANGFSKKCFSPGEDLAVRIHFHARRNFYSPEFSVGFHTEEGVLLSKATTRDHRFPVNEVSGGGEVIYRVPSLPLNPGRYLLTIGCWDSTGHVAYDYHQKLYELIVMDDTNGDGVHERFGFVHIPAQWEIHSQFAESAGHTDGS